MGVRVRIAGKRYEVTSYTVHEDSTPTASEDSTGSVGTITMEVKGVEFPWILDGEDVYLADSRKGSTLGFITEVGEEDNGTATLTCQSRLGRLNIFGVQAGPFVGTFGDAFRYYVGLANQTTDIFIDPAIANRPVVFPGWEGELWYHMKQMAAAQDCEIALVSDVIFMRPLRSREAIDHRNITRSRTFGGATLAQGVEVFCYDNRPITNQLVYPPGGWTPEVRVLSVGAGEEMEQELELEASLTSIQQPTMVTSVGRDHTGSSVYTIVADDGLPVQPKQWDDMGGIVRVTINPDTTSLTVYMRGPERMINTKGEPVSTFSLALGSDVTGNRYSTLRIVGTGVSFNKQSVVLPTCISPRLTGTEIGVTIDNPFISTWNDAYSAGVKAAKLYAGQRMILNGTMTSINQIGDTGSAKYPSYRFDLTRNGGRTYRQVQAANAGRTYRDILEDYFNDVRDEFENQAFGNAGGARVWDRKTHRWYRIRGSDLTPGGVSFDAESDLTMLDVESTYGNMTYAREESMFGDLTYSRRDKMGIYVLPPKILSDTAFPALNNFPSTDKFPEGY